MLLQSPIANQCKESGLKGCDNITEGVLSYINGDKEKGKNKIIKGASENAPQEILLFSDKLKTVSQIPGLESFAEPLAEISNLLKGDNKNLSINESSNKLISETDSYLTNNNVKTESFYILGNEKSYICKSFNQTCLKIGMGKIVISDIIINKQCPFDVSIFTSEGLSKFSNPVWNINFPANDKFNINSAVLNVPFEHQVIISVNAVSNIKNEKCNVTITSHI